MRIPPSFFSISGRILLFLVLEGLCIAMILREGTIQRYTLIEKLRNAQIVFWEKSRDIRNYSNLKKINEQLSRQNAFLLQEVEDLRALQHRTEGSALADSLRSREETGNPFRYSWGRIIRNRTNTLHNYLIIDKGREDGITEDCGIITPQGVVGIVRAVGKKNALVVSFLNAGQNVSARLGKSGALGILEWDQCSADGAVLQKIPQHIEVFPGDTVYTSGYSSLFPPGIPLGVAEESKVVYGTHRSVKVRLFQDFSKLEYVLIARNLFRTEIDSLSTFAGHE